MGIFLVRAVKVENGEVEAAHVSGIGTMSGEPETFAVDDGRILGRADLASLVIVEDVYVATIPVAGEFGLGSRVQRKPGSMEYLTSVGDDGTPNSDLHDLPKLT
jgi:hypothetical protein